MSRPPLISHRTPFPIATATERFLRPHSRVETNPTNRLRREGTASQKNEPGSSPKNKIRYGFEKFVFLKKSLPKELIPASVILLKILGLTDSGWRAPNLGKLTPINPPKSSRTGAHPGGCPATPPAPRASAASRTALPERGANFLVIVQSLLSVISARRR